MKPHSLIDSVTQPPQAMNKLFMSLAVVCIVLITPFAINNFIHGRFSLGIGSAVIVAIFAITAWSIGRRGRYYPTLILAGLLPAIMIFLVFSIKDQGIIGVLWCYPAVISFYFMLPGNRGWIANIGVLVAAIPMVLWMFDSALAVRIVATLAMVSIFSFIFINVIADQQKQLQLQAVSDPLTGALNRALLEEVLEHGIAQNDRTQIPMTLISFDLDHFKQINDTLGHDAGDTVLREVAKILKNRCRSVDKVFRLGGEEFLVFLYNTGQRSASQVAEELRKTIEERQFLSEHKVTMSGGLATLQPGESWREWLKRSDTHLYRAKNTGRNRIAS